MSKFKKTFLFIIFVLLSTSVFGESVFVKGTFAGDTRYDVKKVEFGAEGSPDSLMCWAASASNNLQLWQDNLKNTGYNIPLGIPDGKTQSTYQTDIFYTLVNSWTNDAASSVFAYQWFLTGDYDRSYAGGRTASELREDRISDGGYWSFMNWDMDNLVEVISCQKGSSLHPVEGERELFVDGINRVFANDWLISLHVNNHSVTLAGYEYDTDPNNITGLWLCDSDNPNTNGNYLIDVAWDEGWQAWKLGKAHIDESDIVSDYNNLENGIVISMEVFKVPATIPEPSTYAIIFGAFALIFAIYRKK